MLNRKMLPRDARLIQERAYAIVTRSGREGDVAMTQRNFCALGLAAALVFSGGGGASAAQVGTFELGSSATLCSDYLSQHGIFMSEFTGLSYVLGFVSGAAIFSGDDRMTDFKNAFDIGNAIKRYCTAHPEDELIKAARWLWKTKGGQE